MTAKRGGAADALREAIIADVGPDVTRFLSPGHLVSWAKLSPRTIQSAQFAR